MVCSILGLVCCSVILKAARNRQESPGAVRTQETTEKLTMNRKSVLLLLNEKSGALKIHFYPSPIMSWLMGCIVIFRYEWC